MIVAIPSVSDVAFGVEDLQKMTSTEFLKTQGLIKDMEKELKASVSKLQKRLGNQAAFTQLVSKYYTSLNNLNHALDIHRNRGKEFYYISKKEWAKQLLNNGNILVSSRSCI